MNAGLYLRLARREARGSRGRIAFFLACLAVGVAAVVAVAGLSASLDAGIRAQARPLLAADLAVTSRRPPPPELDALLAALPAAGRAEVRELVTVVAAPAAAGDAGAEYVPGPSVLVELKAVGPGYPFYGTLRTDPDRPLADLLDAGSALAAPELLARLGLAVGDPLRIGGEAFRIAGTVAAEPDRLGIGLAAGPRLFLSVEGLARTGLIQKGSRVEYRTLVRLAPGTADDPAALAAAADRLRAALPAGVRVETWREAQPALRRGVARVDRFLGLVALLSLLVGGIGVAQTVRAWLAGRMDAIAVLKCLGMRPREVLALYLGQTALLGLAGSLVGLAAGVAVQLAIPSLFPDLVPATLLDPWQAAAPAALARGLALGVGVAVLFSVAPLAGILRVPPVRVLRRDAEPPPAHRVATAATAGAVVAGVLAMAVFQARSLTLGAQFTGGLAAAAAALTAGALAVTWAVGRLPRSSGAGRAGLWLRHGLAALARPGAATVGAIVALGLGVLVVVGMSLVERQLSGELSAEVPADAPTAFLVDVQPDQWPGVEALLREEGALAVDSVPVVMARLAAIDGTPVGRIATGSAGAGENQRGERGRDDDDRDDSARWALTREQRLTYMERLPADNRIVAGALWDRPDAAEVSVEKDYADDLGVGLGTRLTFDVQGVPVDLTITSLREVDWRTFGINFFLVVEPGVLDDAPQQRLATVRLPPGSEQRVQDLLAAGFPNVTFVRIREILEKLVAILDRIGLAVRFLGGFTVLAGIAILAGAVSAGSARRAREVALLKTLGVTRAGVVAMFAVEYALVGLVAGAIGTAGGAALAWAVLTRGMEIGWHLHPLVLATALAATALLAATAGIAASARALARRPIEVLRGE